MGCSPELQAIKTAILNEHEGYQFYLSAAEKGESEEVKSVFLYLAEEERQHEEYLKKLYEAVENNLEIDNNQRCKRIEPPRLFSTEELKREQPSLIVSALSMAVKMEKESIDFYRESAERATVGSAKRIYGELADIEGEHLDALNQVYDFAKDEWWGQQGFSPA